MKQSLFVLLLFIIFPHLTHPQQLRLHGKIVDGQDRALENAHLHLNNRFILTDKNGHYRIDNLKRGEYRIQVSFIGFRTSDTLISLIENTSIDFKLREDTAALEAVLLTGNTRRSSSENIEKLNKEYLQNQFSGSLANSLEQLPGVNAAAIGAGSSKPIIRGLGFNRVAVSENGIKQEGQQWGADHGLEIDAFSVEHIEIIKGVGAIEHGSDAIGGVIKIINDRVPSEDGFSGEIIGLTKTVNNTLAISTNLALRKERFFYKIKATGSEFGDYSIPTDNIVYLSRNIPIYNQKLKNTAGKELDLYGQIGFLGEHYKGTFSISNVYLKSGFFPGAHGIPTISRVQDDGDQRNIDFPFQRVNHLKFINKNEWFFHDSSLEVIMGLQNNHRQEWSLFHTHYTGQLPPEVNPDLELNFNLTTYDLQAKYTRIFDEKHTSTLGIQTQIQDNDISGYNFLLPEYTRINQGIYGTHYFQVSKKTNLNLGVRVDLSQIKIEGFYDENLYEYLTANGNSPVTSAAYATRSTNTNRNFSNLNLMGGALFNFHKNWDFSINTGTSFRLPTAIELGANGIHHGSFRHEQGNPNLEAEKGYVFDLKINYKKNSIEAAVSPYAYYFDNYIFLNPSGKFSILPHAGQIYEFTQSRALLAGIEFDSNIEFSKNWHTRITFEYLYNRQMTSDASRNFPLPFTPPVNGFTEFSYEFLKNFKTFRETEIFTNITYAMQQDRIAQNEAITPGYQVFGGGIRSKLEIRGLEFSINLKASNVFNTKYFNHTSFYRAIEIPEMGRNFQLMLKIPIK